MFNILVDYPDEEEEFKIVAMTTAMHTADIERVLSATDILEMQDIVRKVPVAPYVIRYAMKFTRLTRKDKTAVPDFVRDYVTWGAGPRATQFLVLGPRPGPCSMDAITFPARTSAKWPFLCSGTALSPTSTRRPREFVQKISSNA